MTKKGYSVGMATPKHPGGRPSKYNPEWHPQLAKAWAAAGRTEAQIASALGVAMSTISKWKIDYPEFSEALKAGKQEPDDAVERCLFERATGYVNKNAVKIFMPANAKEPVYAPYVEYVAPDVTAQIFWLKNRRPKQWRERVEHTGADGEDLFKAFADAADAKVRRVADLKDVEI